MVAITLAPAFIGPNGLGQSDPPPAGQLLVNWTGLGTKSDPSPIVWETFDGDVDQLVSDYDADWIPYAGDGGIIRDINPRFSGHKSAYNNPARNPAPGGNSQFWTNYKTNLARKGRSFYVSYYVRVNIRESGELGGQIKFMRLTSSAASGGGGVYNGTGVHGINAPAPESWQPIWTGSNTSGGQLLADLNGAWYPANRWIKIEYEIYLSDLDTNNGFYNAYVTHEGSVKSGAIMQRFSGYGADNFLIDTVLLGIEAVNIEHWYTPNSLTAATDYTISATHFNATNYSATWNSGGSVPTAAEVVNGLKAALLADGMPEADLRSNPDNLDEFGMYWGYETVVVSENLSRSNPMSVQQGETYVSDDFRQFFIANAPVWADSTEDHAQPPEAWADTQALLNVYFGGITGQKWLFVKLVPEATPTLAGEVVSNGSGGYEVIYA